MISELAKDDIEQLRADGLNPSVADIIRLNALALKYDRARGRNAGDSMYTMPRVAILSDTLYLREPTIGHDIWLDAVGQHSRHDYQTVFALRAYALSRPYDELPDPHNRKAVTDAVEAFLDTLAPFTEEQVFTALNYVQNGLHSEDDEYPPVTAEEGEADPDREDWSECVSLGALRHGLAVMTGLTLADAKSMTRAELDLMVRRALLLQGHDIVGKGEFELGNYYRALHEVRDRLENSRSTDGRGSGVASTPVPSTSPRTTNHESRDTNHG